LEDWALIRRLHRSDGLSQRAIAKQLGIARATVAGALAAAGPPRYERVAVTSSAWLQVEQSVRGLLAETPTMPASVRDPTGALRHTHAWVCRGAPGQGRGENPMHTG